MISFQITKTLKAGQKQFTLQLAETLENGEMVGLLGPSGSGKTTLLRCLAGLEHPDSGFILHGSTHWYEDVSGLWVPPQRRRVAYMFQEHALFPHMTALENIVYTGCNREKARELLALVKMEDHCRHFPRELSGGQSQRVALARALAQDPQLLLFDEPLSSLDENIREELGAQIIQFHKLLGVPAVLVSHSTQEIDRLCTRVVNISG